MKKSLTIIVLACCQIGFSQKAVELKNFKNFAARGNMEITLIKSAENKLVVEEGDAEDLKINTEQGNLALSTENTRDQIKAVVYYNSAIETIAVAAGVIVTGKDILRHQIVLSVQPQVVI